MTNTILVIDVGNTTIKLGFFNKDKLIYSNSFFRINDAILNLKEKIHLNPNYFSIIIGATNEKRKQNLLKEISRNSIISKWIIQIYLLKIDVTRNLGLNKNEIEEIGIDLYSFLSYFHLHGPCSILNFGTAITLINIDKNRNNEILIIPGLEIAEIALRNKAEKISISYENSPTNKALLKGKDFLIMSILLHLCQINKSMQNYTLIISGGDLFEVKNCLKTYGNSSFISKNDDYEIYKMNGTTIHLYNHLTLLSYYHLWLKGQ